MELYSYFQSLMNDSDDVPADSILSQSIHDDEHMKVVKFTFAAGQELSEHTSTYAAVLFFLKGEADVTLGDDHKEAEVGTFVHMTPRLPHSIKAKTNVVMVLMMLKG